MSARRIAHLRRWVPLWKRPIPPYPLYSKGNPQLRIHLPLFWMKMIKPGINVPKGTVSFEVHPQMTDLDIKQYLEKIYEVEVSHVRSGNKKGEEKKHPKLGHALRRERDPKFAFVAMKNETFEYPEIFGGKKTEQSKLIDQYKDMEKKYEKGKKSSWQKEDLPDWFR